MRLGILGMLTLAIFLLCSTCAQETDDAQAKERFESENSMPGAGVEDASDKDGGTRSHYEIEETDKDETRNSSMNSDTESVILINPSRLYNRVKELYDMLAHHRLYYDLLSRQDFHVIVDEVTRLPQYFSDLAFQDAALAPDSREAQPFDSDYVKAKVKVPVNPSLFKSVYKLHQQLSQVEPLVHNAASALQEVIPQYHLDEAAAMDMIHELLPELGVQMEEVGNLVPLTTPPTSISSSLSVNSHSSEHHIPTSTSSQSSFPITKSPMANPQATPMPMESTDSILPFVVPNVNETIGNTVLSLNRSEAMHEISQILSNQTNMTQNKTDDSSGNAASYSKQSSNATNYQIRGNSGIKVIQEINPSMFWWRPPFGNIPVGLLPLHNNRTQSTSDATTQRPLPITDWVVNPDESEPFDDDLLKTKEKSNAGEEQEDLPFTQTKTVNIIETSPLYLGNYFSLRQPPQGGFLIPADEDFTPEPSSTGFELHKVPGLNGMSLDHGQQISLVRTPTLSVQLQETQLEPLKVKPLLTVKDSLFHPSLFSMHAPVGMIQASQIAEVSNSHQPQTFSLLSSHPEAFSNMFSPVMDKKTEDAKMPVKRETEVPTTAPMITLSVLPDEHFPVPIRLSQDSNQPFLSRVPDMQNFQSPLSLAEQDLRSQSSSVWQMHEQKDTGNGTSLTQSALEIIHSMHQSLTTQSPSKTPLSNKGHIGMMNFLKEWTNLSIIHQDSDIPSQADTEVPSIHQGLSSFSLITPEEDSPETYSSTERLQPGQRPPASASLNQTHFGENAPSSADSGVSADSHYDNFNEDTDQATPSINNHAEIFSIIPVDVTTTSKPQSVGIHLSSHPQQVTASDYYTYDDYYYYDNYNYYDYQAYQEQATIRGRAENSPPGIEISLDISKIPGAVPVSTDNQDVQESVPEAASRSTLRPPPRQPALRPRPRPEVNSIRQSIGNSLRPRPNRPFFRPIPSITNSNNPLGFPRRPTTTTPPPPQAIDRLSLLMSQGGTTVPPITTTRRVPTRQQLQDALQLLVALQENFNEEPTSRPPITQSPVSASIINLPNPQNSGTGFQVSLSQRVSGQNQQFEASVGEPVYPPAPPPLPGPPGPIPIPSGVLTGAPYSGITNRPGAPVPNPYPGYRPGSFSPFTQGYPGYPSQYPYPPNQYPYYPPYPPYPYPYPQSNNGCRGGGASTSTSTGPGSAAAAAAAGGGCGGGSTSTSTSVGQSAGAAPGSVSVGGGAPTNPSPATAPQQSVVSAPAPPPRDPAPPAPSSTRPPPFSISFGTGSTTTEAPAVSQEEYSSVVSALHTLMSYLNRTNTQSRDEVPAPPAPPPPPRQVVALPAPNILYYPVPASRPRTTTSRPIARPFLHHLDILLARPAGPRPPAPPPRPPGVSLPQSLPYGGHIGQGQHGQLEAVRPCAAC
ncbi:SH3 domain-containing protein C23A1.17-like isoform X2 [Penaeus monodon]|uniref:SH3 domain-containing protein C23A1.17-like isoform X2 n=1 Tax=Penaeus monodon TaxID=6687 RepID=UPI0018A71571|nr:SH3 domain-containing protein C23A1.17-like isoform X2 [Penaeus monodon]